MSNFIHEGIRGPEFLVSEANAFRSRDKGDVGAMAAADYAPGTVLVAAGGTNAVDDNPVAGNVGNGVLTVSDAGDGNIQAGRYVLTCIAEAANAGTFELVNPEGGVEGTITVGASAVDLGGLDIALADGANDFDIGDAFTIDVTDVAGDFAPAAAGTLTNAVGIAYSAFSTTLLDDVEITIIARDAEIDLEKIQWPTGASAAQKAAGVAALAAKGIIARS